MRLQESDPETLARRVAGFLAEQSVTQLLLLKPGGGHSALMPRVTDLPGLLVQRLAAGESPVRLHAPAHAIEVEMTSHEARVFAGSP